MIAVPSTRPPTTSHYLPALTGLRAAAAFLVFLHHYNPAPALTFAHRLIGQGYVGVSVFFVLSGFLMQYQYAGPAADGASWSWRTYAQNRFARIYPLYAVLLVLTLSINALRGQSISGFAFLLNLTLLKGFFADYLFSGLAQSWSLTVEACFYAAAPVLWMALRRWSAWLPVAVLTAAGLLFWATLGQLQYHGLFGSLSFVSFYLFFGRSFEFIAGMWLAQRWQSHTLQGIRNATGMGLGLISGCVLWQANIGILTINPTGLFWSELIVYNYLLPVGISLFLLGLLQEKSSIRYVLTTLFMQTMGHCSYAFYLIHLGMIPKLLQKLGLTSNWLLLGCLILIAHFLYVTIEKPLHQRLRRRTD
ncbi:acyltransferase family protein [Spirosoma fluminis]